MSQPNEGFDFTSMAGRSGQPGAPRGRTAPAGRHALGMPSGSVRALLALFVIGLTWTLTYLQKEIPAYLYYLMFLTLGHYFAARHQSSLAAAGSSPLYLPRGVIRALIFLGFLAVLGGIYYQNRDNLPQLWENLKPENFPNKYLPLILLIGFFAGLLAAKVGAVLGGREGAPGWYQDIQAWLALLAMIGLCAAIVIKLVINPTLNKPIDLPPLDNFLAAIVGCYFGARS